MFYHSLAILHAPAYREENAGALRQDWPRIPLSDSKKLLLASAALGKHVAALLDMESASEAAAPAPKSLGTKLAVPARVGGGPLDETKDLAVTAGWGHAGKGGATMPGKGNIKERDYTDEERKAIEAAAKEQGISAEESFQRLGDRTADVYLNEVAYWKNIPMGVWQYSIGGYQVIKKWLSYREEKLLGRPLRKEEVREVQEIARRIAAVLLLQPALDANDSNVKDHAFKWEPE